MAKQSLKIVTNGRMLEWRDRATDDVVYTFDTGDVSETLRDNVFLYGAKQIIADGGATGVDVPLRERINKMETRAQALRDGTWGERRATPAANADLFRALVALGLVADNEEKRKQFRTLPAATISDLYKRDDVAEWLKNNTFSVSVSEFLGE
jgi:hypothetical protein